MNILLYIAINWAVNHGLLNQPLLAAEIFTVHGWVAGTLLCLLLFALSCAAVSIIFDLFYLLLATVVLLHNLHQLPVNRDRRVLPPQHQKQRLFNILCCPFDALARWIGETALWFE